MFEVIQEADQFILLAALILVISVVVTKFSNRLGVPSLVLFILLGMLIGSDGLGYIYFDSAKIAQLIGMVALIIILFEGGIQTKWETIKPVMAPALTLATIGVLITSGLVGLTAKLLFDISWLEAMLIGSIVGSTDAAAVFAVLKGKNIKENLQSTLEAESGTNDPMAVFLTLSMIQLITLDDLSISGLIFSFFWQMGAGLIIGFLVGKLATISINGINLDSSGLYPLFALAFAFITYSTATLVSASGFLAVYIAAVVIGNSNLTYRHSILRFNEGFGWMAQITMFILLGLFVFPSTLFTTSVLWNGLLISLVLMFVARPIATFISLYFFRFSIRENIFLSWAGLRGAVPIVLALFPVLLGLENSQLFFNVVFFVVLLSALVQGSTITKVAGYFNLLGPEKRQVNHSLELVSLGRSNVEMVEYEVTPSSKLIGKQLKDITFPNRATVNAVIINDRVVAPSGDTAINVDDVLYILVHKGSEHQLKQMLK
ncbi:potassium/proton antiporter [Gracilibacillus oryzae]|uniref:Potassium/proton antiporter n=1 Tax=Gracilibacillus oryzae TaxID=1672701 RepID=A0A7C8KRR0_9BACI|nr:potassium/proton antiporter [Gracilibacillus oryzae]KAB8134691.1 potassium/proton antiporter [Gracilibacillus oryzae]